MYCPKCGTENVEGAKLCSKCSWALSSIPGGSREGVKTSGVAKAALVLGILGIFTGGLTILPALICGIVALVKISKSGGMLRGKGMAITGIVLPLLLPLFLAIMLPALGKVRRIAQQVVCATNLKHIGAAMQKYQEENDGELPMGAEWCDLLVADSNLKKDVFRCRRAVEGPSTYAMNEGALRANGELPDDMVVVFESGPSWNQVEGLEDVNLENHYEEGCNVLFADGHVEFVKVEDVNDLLWEVEE